MVGNPLQTKQGKSIDVIEVHKKKAEFSLRLLGEAFLKQRTREGSLPSTE